MTHAGIVTTVATSSVNQAWDEWVDLANPPQRACLGVTLEGQDLVEIVVTAAD